MGVQFIEKDTVILEVPGNNGNSIDGLPEHTYLSVRRAWGVGEGGIVQVKETLSESPMEFFLPADKETGYFNFNGRLIKVKGT